MLAAHDFQTQLNTKKRNAPSGSHSDGSVVTIRLIRSEDLTSIQDMHDRLSNDSLYYRYLGSNKPSRSDLVQLCSSNGSSAVVLVGAVREPEENIIGIACYRVNSENPRTAEPAILVEDRCQGCGLGKKLIIALCQQAIQNGIERFDSYIHPANFRVLQMIKTSGLSYECKYRDGLKEIRVWLTQKV